MFSSFLGKLNEKLNELAEKQVEELRSGGLLSALVESEPSPSQDKVEVLDGATSGYESYDEAEAEAMSHLEELLYPQKKAPDEGEPMHSLVEEPNEPSLPTADYIKTHIRDGVVMKEILERKYF